MNTDALQNATTTTGDAAGAATATATATTPAESKRQQKKSFIGWIKGIYHDQYEKWVPWLEDLYLRWFGKGDNKASYVTKGWNSFLFTFLFILLIVDR